MRLPLLLAFDIVDRVLDGRDLLGGIVGNLDAKLFLEGHDQFDDVEAVRTQIVNEAGILGDPVGLDAEMLDDDFFTRSAVSLMLGPLLWSEL